MPPNSNGSPKTVHLILVCPGVEAAEEVLLSLSRLLERWLLCAGLFGSWHGNVTEQNKAGGGDQSPYIRRIDSEQSGAPNQIFVRVRPPGGETVGNSAWTVRLTLPKEIPANDGRLKALYTLTYESIAPSSEEAEAAVAPATLADLRRQLEEQSARQTALTERQTELSSRAAALRAEQERLRAELRETETLFGRTTGELGTVNSELELCALLIPDLRQRAERLEATLRIEELTGGQRPAKELSVAELEELVTLHKKIRTIDES